MSPEFYLGSVNRTLFVNRAFSRFVRPCYSLNVCTHTHTHFEELYTNVIVIRFGGRTIGRGLNHEDKQDYCP